MNDSNGMDCLASKVKAALKNRTEFEIPCYGDAFVAIMERKITTVPHPVYESMATGDLIRFVEVYLNGERITGSSLLAEITRVHKFRYNANLISFQFPVKE